MLDKGRRLLMLRFMHAMKHCVAYNIDLHVLYSTMVKILKVKICYNRLQHLCFSKNRARCNPDLWC